MKVMRTMEVWIVASGLILLPSADFEVFIVSGLQISSCQKGITCRLMIALQRNAIRMC